MYWEFEACFTVRDQKIPFLSKLDDSLFNNNWVWPIFGDGMFVYSEIVFLQQHPARRPTAWGLGNALYIRRCSLFCRSQHKEYHIPGSKMWASQRVSNQSNQIVINGSINHLTDHQQIVIVLHNWLKSTNLLLVYEVVLKHSQAHYLFWFQQKRSNWTEVLLVSLALNSDAVLVSQTPDWLVQTVLCFRRSFVVLI